MRSGTSRQNTRASRRAAIQPDSGAEAAEAQDVSSADRVVNHITAGVLAGRYVPGQRLVEADLTRALRVSRGPVREAFRRLDALGILSRTMHRGACIRKLSRDEAADLMVAIEAIDMLTSRLAASAVKSRSGGRRLSELERELRPYRDREYDLAGMPQKRQQFYDILIAIAGNSQLPSLFPTMRIHLLRLQTQSYRNADARNSDVDDFAAVARAILAGDPGAAEKASAAHDRRVLKTLRDLPDEAFPAE
ncbi:MAG: GntR family transcriptional regulator [Steroidobacteraceae bacterium]